MTADRLAAAPQKRLWRLSLVTRYALFVSTVVACTLTLNLFVGAIFATEDQRLLVARAQYEQARRVADRIEQFVAGALRQMDAISMAGADQESREQQRLDGLKLMRQAAVIVDLRQARADGRETLALSRLARDRMDSGIDLSREPAFVKAMADGIYIGPVFFFRETEPRIELAVRSQAQPPHISIVTLNLTFIWELVADMKVGAEGRAYIATSAGRLIAHPDLRYVLRDTQLEGGGDDEHKDGDPLRGVLRTDVEGRRVLSVSAPVAGLGWLVYVDLPQSEAFTPIIWSLARSGMAGVGALALALLASIMVSRRMAAPIMALRDGAALIGEGRLDHRIAVDRADEIGALGSEFNKMAARLEDARAVLDARVAERTAELSRSRDDAVRQREAAEAARHAAERATEEKTRFLAVVGHDIRTPVAALVGVVGLLDRTRMSEHDRRLIAMAASSGEALVELINSILDLSRIEADAEIVDTRDFEPADLATAAAEMIRSDAARKNLALRVECDASASTPLLSDPVKINRIILNLLRNAVTFTDAGEIRLSLRVEAQSSSAATLIVVVKDTGVGVHPDDHARIFEDFAQIEPKRAGGGVGLGLAICKRLASLLGGTLTLESALGAGSTFTLRVPVALASSSDRTSQLHSGEAELAVLVVDDDALNLEVTSGICRRLGHQTMTASGGGGALELIRTHRFDAILLDMHMDGMDGAELATELARQSRDAAPALIGLTADTSPDTLRRFRAAGVTTVLSKPVAMQALGKALTRVAPTGAEPDVHALDGGSVIDRSFIEDRRDMLGGERLRQLATLFHAASADLMIGVSTAAMAEDRAGVSRACHQLASAASAIGLGLLYREACRLERESVRSSEAELRAGVAALGDICRRTRAELDRYLADEITDEATA
ncbi:hybrid sensor histidine kinase/response regulator [Terrarubrum flagellatum]|uniref:hybrid sensor histidine kinase/response regulator n=1 Tax=Terrirubrum flagellatum TaxID=2895980 RepID=UPI0031454AF8